jgi:hypothetical protein
LSAGSRGAGKREFQRRIIDRDLRRYSHGDLPHRSNTRIGSRPL